MALRIARPWALGLALWAASGQADGSFANASGPALTSGIPSTALPITAYQTAGVSVTVAPDVTVVERLPFGTFGLVGETTFTLTGPTVFSTFYVDTINIGLTYWTTTTTISVPAGTITTETLPVSVDVDHIVTGSAGPAPRAVTFISPSFSSTTLTLDGPTVLVTQALGVQIWMDSPPWVLQTGTPASPTTSPGAAAPSRAAPARIPTIGLPTSHHENPAAPTVLRLAPSVGPGPSAPAQPSPPPPSPPPPSPPPPSPPPPSPTPVGDGPAPTSTALSAAPAVMDVASQTALLGGPVPPVATPAAAVPIAVLVGSQTAFIGGPPTPAAGGGGPAAAVTAPAGAAPNVVVVGSQTAFLGGPAITVSSTAIALVSGGLVVGTSTIALAATAGSAPPPAITVGGQAVRLGQASSLVVDGETAFEGGPAITVGSTPVSFGPAGVRVGTSLIPIAALTAGGGAGGGVVGGASASGGGASATASGVSDTIAVGGGAVTAAGRWTAVFAGVHFGLAFLY